MTDVSTSAWAFAVARGHTAGYQLLLAPDFLVAARESGLLLNQVQGEVPEPGPPAIADIAGPASGPLCVVHRTARLLGADVGATRQPQAALLDRAGRPLVLAYGFVCRGIRVAADDDRDLLRAREEAVATYRQFYAAEADFVPAQSHAYPLRSAVTPLDRQTDLGRAPGHGQVTGGAATPAAAQREAPWTSQILPTRPGPPPARRRTALLAGLLVAVLAVFGITAAFVYRGQADEPTVEQVAVPNVIGRNEADATQRLRDEGLVPEIEWVPNGGPAGTVVASDPEPGGRVPRGSTVRLTVSSGPGGTSPPPSTAGSPTSAPPSSRPPR
ncbi:PASTA domain-containing protein [Virgisporangium aurantiacum]|uniref:PASTA domain-containing protein n=1 Tax=Virgisporangium aurantiacum TaxID=175570 RepID=A0A8J4E6D0_9ACTN|nr:PASTA domain-containing protein [Virgisporangium aurantiacum]GIJ63296.1 hypothetical protein Vau01_108120 [Virgisporangium aurantiacum]